MKIFPGRHSEKGFTLVELLVVIGIIGLLIGLIIPAVTKARAMADRNRAETEVQELVKAYTAYFNEYNRWPPHADPTKIGKTMLDILTGSSTNNNRNLRVFLEIPNISTNTVGELVDPWDTPYYCAFDDDFSNSIGAGSLKRSDCPNGLPGRRVVVWSYGPNRKQDDKSSATYDDVVSW